MLNYIFAGLFAFFFMWHVILFILINKNHLSVVEDINKRNKTDKRGNILGKHALDYRRRVSLFEAITEVYPPLGILGTVTGLYFSVASGGTASSMDSILGNFVTAMWTTFIGLGLWIVFTMLFALRASKWEDLLRRFPDVLRKGME